jgi:hypothetical protein
VFELGISALQASAGAMLCLTIVLVLTGKLEWHKHHAEQLRDVRKDCDERVKQSNAEAARWRNAYEYSEEARRIDARHAEHLLDLGYASNRIIAALPIAPKEDPDASAPAVEE